uniref:Uncharacterized protein n=1 Tax=uncultured Chlorobiota bacterium TaxID=156405 RepID=H5SGR1_9BACT|nr:hypothetical protein HGMM_F27B02C49 [uncultured Chlorobiota bacterium]
MPEEYSRFSVCLPFQGTLLVPLLPVFKERPAALALNGTAKLQHRLLLRNTSADPLPRYCGPERGYKITPPAPSDKT